ncbi:MAG TPA: MBL fold metallo-hydrolase [Nitrosopumilaceae archaeon]|nr:MBL fold metallo-hydrolase [Nitrosopumilaceae archaeon]
MTPLLFTVLIQNSFSEFTEESECREGYVLVFRTNVSRYACVFNDTATEWESSGIAEVTGEIIVEETPEETPEDITITSFEECVAAGNAVMESYPRQCKSADGQTFVEEIEMSEEIGIYPETINFTSHGPIMGDAEYFVSEIAKNVYWLVGAGYQTMFVTTGEGVIAVDAPQPIGENYLKAISEVTEEPVVYMVYTHSHQDHTGSAAIFSNATFVSHAQAAEALILENDTNRPIPTETFDDSLYTLSLGNQTLELHHIGNFHSPGDLVIYAPSQKVLMIDDLMRPGESPYKAFGVTPDIDLYLQTHDTLLNDFDFDVLISGHTNILGTKDSVMENKQFTLDVMQNAEDALVAGEENPEQVCASVSIEQWNQTLANLDAFMIDHCLAMIEYLSQDSTNETETVEPEDPFSVSIPVDEDLTDVESVSIPVPDDDTRAQVKRQLDLLTFKIEQMVELAENQDVINAVIASNNRFAAMKDANAYIAEKDQEWIKTPRQETSVFMAAIIQSGVSDLLRDKTSIPTQEFGNVLFPEIIVTNSYGANVGISQRTDDYNQADEVWWINGKKVPIHLREVAWDQSAEIFSSDIIIKIVDGDGKFIGVLKAVTPIRDV